MLELCVPVLDVFVLVVMVASVLERVEDTSVVPGGVVLELSSEAGVGSSVAGDGDDVIEALPSSLVYDVGLALGSIVVEVPSLPPL